MAIRFVCPLCWAVRDDVDDSSLGKVIKCHDCHAMSVALHSPAPKYAVPIEPRAQVSAWIDAAMKPVSGPAVVSPPVAVTPPPALSSEPTDQVSQTPSKGPTPVLFSTGDIRQRYRIVDLVFAHGTSLQGSLKGTHAGQAFRIMVEWLSRAAVQVGADAVIHTHIDFRPGSDPQAFEVYAYGTAVKLEEA